MGDIGQTKRWRGLAVILLADGPSRHFVGYRNCTLLEAADILRNASSVKGATAEVGNKLAGEQCEYVDLKEGEPLTGEEKLEHLSESEQ